MRLFRSRHRLNHLPEGLSFTFIQHNIIKSRAVLLIKAARSMTMVDLALATMRILKAYVLSSDDPDRQNEEPMYYLFAVVLSTRNLAPRIATTSLITIQLQARKMQIPEIEPRNLPWSAWSESESKIRGAQNKLSIPASFTMRIAYIPSLMRQSFLIDLY